MAVERSPFKNGFWGWDQKKNQLGFTSRDKEVKEGFSSATATSSRGSTSRGAAGVTTIEFKEAIDSVDQARFRRYFQRRVKPGDPDVITIQDIKDVVMFSANPRHLALEFIHYFHIPAVDKFLRALIVYFAYYIQVWDKLMARRQEAKRKLRQPIVYELENIVRDNLADLRSMVAREYLRILLGLDDARKFYHMNNKNNDSLSDKDRRLLEFLITMCVRVVWIAMQRKYLGLIEKEIHRLLRTNLFSIPEHRPQKTTVFDSTAEEQRVLLGKAYRCERKLKHRSPCVQEITFDDHDYRMMAIGVLEIEPRDERLEYLEACYAAPEEMLLDQGIGIGILGVPREDLDAMMKPKQRTKSKKETKEPRPIPEFCLPPKIHYTGTQASEVLPDKPCRYKETIQTKLARKRQNGIWADHICSGGSTEEICHVKKPVK